uniref:uncharacterized protein LOC125407675 isoform X2 n=1 Tax=Myodes glareolus TaxID=447135 RepID=UPI0020218AA4|nr:uncharacterized protein LOC125407675 isoform X2 [Myodes glareolus]
MTQAVRQVLPTEYSHVTQTPTNKQEHPGSLVKMEPEKHKHVSPEPPNSTTSPEYQPKHPIRMVKVKSRECRYGMYSSKIWRKFHWKCSIVPKDSQGLQAQAGTSTERSKSEIEVSYAPSKSTASTVDQQNPPVRAVEVISKKCRCVSTLLKIISRKRPVIPLGVAIPQVTAGPRETAQIKTEVVHKNADTALSPMVKVGCRKLRCIPEVLREFYDKQATANQDANAHSAEMAQMKMEELPDRADTTVTPDGPGTMVKVKCKKFSWISSLFKRFWKKTPVTSRNVQEPPVVENTFVRTPEAQRKGLSNVPDIKQIFFREEEFDHYNEGAWEDYQSYFPDGIPLPESRHTMVSTMVESYVAQVGDTDIEDQQNLDSKESFPDAFEVQQWELRKESSTENPVLNVLFLAPPKSSDEDVVIIKKKRKQRRRRYY